MRLWTLHPGYLDSKGLVALWREALLAQKVLLGETRGYRHHPQLARFRAHREPAAAIATYLWFVADEADRREFTFDTDRIRGARRRFQLVATRGQVAFEWAHLMHKLEVRDPERARLQATVKRPVAHPLFRLVTGPVAEWERGV